MGKPAVHYWPLRGRAEAIRLLLASQNVEYDEVSADYNEMKSDLIKYPFGQAPRYTDDDVDIVQSNTIIRYLARKHGLMGKGIKEEALVDMVMEGVESVRSKYLGLVYQDQLADAAKEKWWETHGAAESATSRNNGAHLKYLANFVTKNGGPYILGTALSAADLCVADVIDLLLRIMPEKLKESYPELVKHHETVFALPGVKAYVEGPVRPTKVNGNNLG